MSKQKQAQQATTHRKKATTAAADANESEDSSSADAADSEDEDEDILPLASTHTDTARPASAKPQHEDEEEEESGAAAGKAKGGNQKHPPHHRGSAAVERKKAAASEKWADKYAAKQERRYAGREAAGGRVVTVKQERQRIAKEEEISSGVSAALQQLAIKKKEKEKRRRQRRQQRQQHDEDIDQEENADNEEEEEEQEEDEQEEDASGADADSAGGAGGADGSEDDAVDSDVVQYGSLDEEIAAYREQHGITISTSLTAAASSSSSSLHSDPVYYPLRSFSDLQTQFSLPLVLISSLIPPSFKSPTPIQAQGWPLILAGKDVVGVASTGSGKTLAFLLGALVFVLKRKGWLERMQRETEIFNPPPSSSSSSSPPSSPPSPLVLILSPTRELALQTYEVAAQACALLHLVAMSLVGGPSIDGQLSLLSSQPPDIVIATPGRLQKHLRIPSLSLSRCGCVVLDEADRMLDLGFHDAIAEILKGVTGPHQTLLFTATWPPAISQVALAVMRPDRIMKVTVGSDDLAAARSVRQIVEVVDRRNGQRERRLLQLLNDQPPSPASLLLVFTLYKRESTQLADYLTRHQHPALALNSSLSQAQRTSTLASFRSGKPPILVATDVAARGLDIPAISTVVCFSLGLSVEHWVHRVGRCGRAGRKGTAYTFVVPDWDVASVEGLVRVLEEGGTKVSEELKELAARGRRRAGRHKEEEGLAGDRLIGMRLKKGKVGGEEEDEDEIEERIFGKEGGGGGIQRGKKQHAIHQKGKSRGRRGRGR